MVHPSACRSRMTELACSRDAATPPASAGVIPTTRDCAVIETRDLAGVADHRGKRLVGESDVAGVPE
jgi:hypothetical protein